MRTSINFSMETVTVGYIGTITAYMMALLITQNATEIHKFVNRNKSLNKPVLAAAVLNYIQILSSFSSFSYQTKNEPSD